MNNNMSLKEAIAKKATHFEGCTAQEVYSAQKVFDVWQKTMKSAADEASEKLKELIPVGTQMSLEFDGDSFLASGEEKVSINATDPALLDAVADVYPSLITFQNKKSLSAKSQKGLIELYNSGSLDSKVQAVIKVTSQGTLKFKKDTTKKEDEEEASE